MNCDQQQIEMEIDWLRSENKIQVLCKARKSKKTEIVVSIEAESRSKGRGFITIISTVVGGSI